MLLRIDRVAGNRQGATNRSRLIREAVREYLSRIERVSEEEREREIFRKHKAQLAREAAALVKEQARL